MYPERVLCMLWTGEGLTISVRQITKLGIWKTICWELPKYIKSYHHNSRMLTKTSWNSQVLIKEHHLEIETSYSFSISAWQFIKLSEMKQHQLMLYCSGGQKSDWLIWVLCSRFHNTGSSVEESTSGLIHAVGRIHFHAIVELKFDFWSGYW